MYTRFTEWDGVRQLNALPTWLSPGTHGRVTPHQLQTNPYNHYAERTLAHVRYFIVRQIIDGFERNDSNVLVSWETYDEKHYRRVISELESRGFKVELCGVCDARVYQY